MSECRVEIRARRARPFFARHPWVFAGSIARIHGRPEVGSEVAVESAEGQFVALGLFNPASSLRVRLYCWEAGTPLDQGFWESRIRSALELRAALPEEQRSGNAERLVFSEADGLSGLVVDRFGRHLVAQFSSHALWKRREMLGGILLSLVPNTALQLRFDTAIAPLEGFEEPPPVEPAEVGDESDLTIDENGLRYLVDLRAGQKTGFYLDQRSNRRAAASYARGRSALDLFCYSGGFSLNLSHHGGARDVLGIDSSTAAISLARRNALINGIENTRFEVADVFRALEQLRREDRRFGLIVCDPPKFARSPRDLEDAMRGCLRLNRAVVDRLEPGGILVTCSCSGIVDRTMFLGMLAQVAELERRPIRVLEYRGQPPDHPISASCPETEYLKCLIAQVD